VLPESYEVEQLSASPMAIRAASNPFPDLEATNERWWRAAEIPAANGHGNAMSVALVQSIISGRGEARGVRLLSEAGVDRAFEAQIEGIDLVLGFDLRFGMGYGLANDLVPLGPRGCFWGGLGGSIIVMDQDADLTIAYAMNRMSDLLTPDMRGFSIVFAAIAGLAGV